MNHSTTGVFFYLRRGWELDEVHHVRADNERDAREMLAIVERCPDDCEIEAQRALADQPEK